MRGTPGTRATELQPIIDKINKLSEQITGQHATATYQSLNELVSIVDAKYGISLSNPQFSKFRKNFEKFSKSQKPAKPKTDEFVFIPSKWQFRPENLTEHQKEKLKEKRVDIPALYNDMSQSQDSHSVSLKPWTPNKQLQVDSAEPPSQIVDEPVGDGKQSIEITKSTDGTLDTTSPIQPSHTDTMASTSLEDNTNSTNCNGNYSTPTKLDEEERKRRRVQNELNKLQMSIANADQYSNQGRTRRMSVTLTKPELKLRKRAKTLTDKPTPIKRTRRSTATLTENSESESSDIIEASQTLTTTPKTRRARQRNVSLGKMQNPKDDTPVRDAEKSSKTEEIIEPKEEVNVDLSESVDSRSTGEQDEQNVQETETFVVKTYKDDPELLADQKPENSAQEENVTGCVEVHNAEAFVVKSESIVEILPEKSDEVAIPQENIDHSPIEDAHSEVVTEPILASPVKEHADEMSIIITSPSTNKNCPKTTELLNSTVDISPIPHPKTTKNVDGTTDPKNNHHQQDASSTEMECDHENIDSDQIKRTDLDNLIKTPMDSPMLQIQKPYNHPANSTPQSHKDSKTRKFQMQGRGAQLLQLMNIRKVEEAVSKAKVTSLASIESTTTPAENIPPITNNFMTYEDILASNKDLFRFSKVHPYSPQASPSSSIMKRNIAELNEVDDIESPNQKRKRVSFHDPPVSATKEFLRFAEEVNPNRQRMNRHSTSPMNARYILTRKGRADSMNEIKKCTLPSEIITSNQSDTSMKSLKFGSTEDDEDVAVPLLTFSNSAEVIQHVLDEYPMEDVLGKYFESGLTLNDSSSKIFATQLENSMKNDEAKRKLVLEDLSEKFPKEFLDVALQENLTSTVIQRLPTTNMLNYITEQAKTDNRVKDQLMEKFLSVVTDESTSESSAQGEMKEDSYKLLLKVISQKMSDKQLLDVLDVLFEKRRTNSCS